MSERYWLTGVELGLLVCIDSREERDKLANEIIENKLIGNFESDEEKRQFEKQIANIKKRLMVKKNV